MENCMTNRQANPTILPLHVHDNQNGLDYTLHGDYYLPDIKNPETDSRPIGKWGRMHLVYLKEHKPGLYSRLILSGRLYRDLADLNEQAQARLEVIIQQMQRSEGVDERMKSVLLSLQQVRSSQLHHTQICSENAVFANPPDSHI